LALPAVQAPAWQESLSVQAFSSLQPEPSLANGLLHTPVVLEHSPGKWHSSSALHATVAPPLQTPPPHVSPTVHASPSWQAVPSGLTGCVHSPVETSHAPTEWQSSNVVHVTSPLPAQPPAWHKSVNVQGLPSSQSLPVTDSFLHRHLSENTQESVVHGSLSSHAVAPFSSLHGQLFSPAHLPPLHMSLSVQGLPSSQDPVLSLVLHAPVFVSQETSVHGLSSGQDLGDPEAHVSSTHVSFSVHALPSEHPPAMATFVQPYVPAGMSAQASAVQALPSLHAVASSADAHGHDQSPPWQVPPWH